MKICNNCNSMQPDEASFCSNCGSSSLRNAVENMAYYDNYNFAEVKKRKNKKIAIIISVLALIMVVLLAAAAIKIFSSSAVPNNGISDDTPDYVYGTISQDVYTNEWADLRFQLTDGWENAAEEKYKAFDGELTKCDFHAIYTDGSNVVVMIMDLSRKEFQSYSENQLLDELSEGFIEGVDNAEKSENSYQTVANQLYSHTSVNGKVDNTDIDVCISAYVKKIDNKAVFIAVTSNTIEKNNSVIEMFQAYNS